MSFAIEQYHLVPLDVGGGGVLVPASLHISQAGQRLQAPGTGRQGGESMVVLVAVVVVRPRLRGRGARAKAFR